MAVAPIKKVRCANCGIEIKWAVIEKEGKVYCWEGCAEGDPVPIRLPLDDEGEDNIILFRQGHK